MPEHPMRRAERGNVVLEFTLVGLPMLFVLVSTFEVARGMWVYHTLAAAAKEAARFTAVHGNECVSTGNNCAVKVSDIAAVIQYRGLGLDPALLSVTLTGLDATQVPPVASSLRKVSGKLADLSSDGSYWPVTYDSVTGFSKASGAEPGDVVSVELQYPFSSAIAMFWPGAGTGINFPTFNLPASARETIQF